MQFTYEQMQMAENQAEMISQEVQVLSYELEQIEDTIQNWSATQKYAGKTVDEWTEYFSIPMNPNATPMETKQYAVMLNERIDEAERNRGKVLRIISEYKAKYMQAKGDIIEAHANNRSRKTIPAADTLEKIAEAELGIKTSFVLKLENELNFWQNMIFKLKDTLKIIQLMTMSNGTLAKIEGVF